MMDARESVRNLVEDVLESKRGATGIPATPENIFNKAKLIQKLQKQGVHPRDIHRLTGVHPSQQPPVLAAAPLQPPKSLSTPPTPPTPPLQLLKSPPTPPLRPLNQPSLQHLQKQHPPGGPPPPPPGGLQHLQVKAKHKGLTPSNKPAWHVKAAKYLGKQALSYHSPIGLGITAGLDALVPGLGIVSRAVQQTFGDQVDRSPFGLPNHNVRDWAKQQIDHSASRADWKNLPSSLEHYAVNNVFSKIKPHMNKAAIKHRINGSKATTHSELRSALEFE
jgi:hypothetical protein